MKFFDYFYREECIVGTNWSRSWDVFVSAWDGSDRVRRVYDHVTAAQKLWIIHPEYRIDEEDLPPETNFVASGGDANGMQALIAHLRTLCNLQQCHLCIDITGMLRPQIAVLVKLLRDSGVPRFDAIYSQPENYPRGEQTRFSSGEVTAVKEIPGFSGVNRPGAYEVLIVAPGFDDALHREVFSHKASAARFQLFGLPSLQADMYQQNILKAYGIDTLMPDDEVAGSKRFAAAADPFAVATELSAIVSDVKKKHAQARFYVAALGPKPQMLGAALYYLTESATVPVSLIYPVVSAHLPATSSGISTVSINTIEFSLVTAISVLN